MIVYEFSIDLATYIYPFTIITTSPQLIEKYILFPIITNQEETSYMYIKDFPLLKPTFKSENNKLYILYDNNLVREIEIVYSERIESNINIKYKIREYFQLATKESVEMENNKEIISPHKSNEKKYEIVLNIKLIVPKIFLSIKIKIPMTTNCKSPFNLKTKKQIIDTLLLLNSSIEHKENTYLKYNFIINANKKTIFDTITNMNVEIEDYCKIYKVDNTPKITSKGDLFIIEWFVQKSKLFFEVIGFENYKDEEEDCLYMVKQIDSNPKQIGFIYKTIIKSISKSKSLIVIEEIFEEPISSSLMEVYKQTVVEYYKSIKEFCESPIKSNL